MTVEIRVFGNPAPQGSKKFLGVKNGRGILVESSKAVKPWREAVKWAAKESWYWTFTPFRGSLDVDMIFTLPRPKSAKKGAKPSKKPDLSKLVRSTEDALTDAGIWEDDARVVCCLARKVYPNEGQDALPVPGALIRITESR